MNKQINKDLEILKNGGGLIITEPTETDAIYDRIFGSQIEKPFDWRPFVPKQENQQRTAFCVSYSYNNILETMAKKDGGEVNLSDRYLGVISKTSLNGNSFQNVSEAGRKQGIVEEQHCPWKPEWLSNPRKYWGNIRNLLSVPKTAKRYFGPNYSRLSKSLISLKSALAHSPLHLGVPVGSNWENDIVNPPKRNLAYHGVMGSFIGKYIYIEDSIGKPHKKLTLNYPVLIAQSYRPLPDDWKILNKMLKRINYKGEQYAVNGNTIHHIPDEPTLKMFMGFRLLSQEMENVKSIDNYKEGEEIPSVVVYQKVKSLMPSLEDAFNKKEKISSGEYKSEPAWWTKIKNLFNK
jgi:hypothetical protein